MIVSVSTRCLVGVVCFATALLLCALGLSQTFFSSTWFPLAALLHSSSNSKQPGDSIPVSISKVWPYHNPTETYDFFQQVGICSPATPDYEPMSLGQLLRGERLTRTRYELIFPSKDEFGNHGEEASSAAQDKADPSLGDKMADIFYSLPRELCHMRVTEEQLEDWRMLIDDSFIIEAYVDGLPVYIPIGMRVIENIPQQQLSGEGFPPDMESIDENPEIVEYNQAAPQLHAAYYLSTHLVFVVGLNENQIVSAQVGPAEWSLGSHSGYTDIAGLLAPGETREIVFRYSVVWERRPDIPVHLRLYNQIISPISGNSKWAKDMIFNSDHLEGHWLALANSFLLVVIILIALAITLMRTLRSDLSSVLLAGDEETGSASEETGWKLLYADIFRPPPHRMALAAMVGCGLHLLLILISGILVASVSPLLSRGSVQATIVMSYLLTTFIAGFFSSSVYTKSGGQKWAWNIIIACGIFLLPAFIIWSLLNILSAAASSSAALPLSSAFGLLLCVFCVSLPLTILGGVLGRRRAMKQLNQGNAFPCRTNKLAREVPLVRWYRRPVLQMVAGAALPFSGIYLELHFLFLSLWTTSKVHAYFLFLAVILLLASVAAVSVLLTYIHLNAEDHRWQWPAFISGGSVSLYFIIHIFQYYCSCSEMTGWLQACHFFGYSLLVAWGVCLTLGCVSYFSAKIFVSTIYCRIKAE